ncbi:MAG: heparinase II/III family protein, partial [Eubacteriales bacterium]|nr:heparinase II/III family protein [Eubacteriales bacterium]
NDVFHFEGSHRGYRESLGCTHKRRFEYHLKNHILRIEDILDNPSEASVFLHFNDDIKILPINKRKVVIEDIAEIGFNAPYRIEEAYISKRYGEKTAGTVISIKGKYSIITEISITREARKS